ncbi:MAG: hypothetical protein KME31_34405 [Tolypothrix carrinoi HA7290-LM1]|nr:hypothetical protein [Tolypothrix carrinoi HA7290-LM1]
MRSPLIYGSAIALRIWGIWKCDRFFYRRLGRAIALGNLEVRSLFLWEIRECDRFGDVERAIAFFMGD